MFFALDIRQKDKATIASWSEQICLPNTKKIMRDNFHITLAFLGQLSTKQKTYLIEQANEIQQQLVITKQDMELTIDELGFFKKPQVLYFGFSSFPPPFEHLADKLSKQALRIGLYQETRKYKAHISIARKAKQLTEVAEFSIPITIDSFSLYLSQSTEHGVVYSPVKTWSI